MKDHRKREWEKSISAKTTMAVTMAALLMTVVLAGCGNKSSSNETDSAVSEVSAAVIADTVSEAAFCTFSNL